MNEKTDNFLKAIQRLVGVSQHDFNLLYRATYQAVADHVNHDITVLTDIQRIALIALKRRKGYILPQGSDSETQSRQKEEWTFAVYCFALLSPIISDNKLALAKKVVPEKGYQWLLHNQKLFALWQDALLDPQQDNIFNTLSTEAITQKAHIINDQNIVTSSLPSASISPNVGETVLINSNKIQSIDSIKTQLTATRFFNWLIAGIIQKTISMNQDNDFVHCVSDGLFIILKESIIAFKGSVSIDKQITTKEIIKLTKAIKKDERLIKNNSGSLIHTFCKGAWQQRHLLKGIIIPHAEFKTNNLDFSINPTLTHDPLTD